MTDPASSDKGVRPLDAVERRVLGTLIEKGKTTPEQYPLSLNALVTGCNQKSNRDPVMTLDEEQVTRAILSLRASGAMAEVFGSGKIPRYRHLAYEWLGVEKEELAILGELLLRGEQTEGDLRGRASRMDPIPDLDALRGHLDRLAARGLVVWLSPPGRGRMLTHGLLPAEKLEKVRVALGLTAVGPQAPAGDVEQDEDEDDDSEDDLVHVGRGTTADSPAPAEADLEARVRRLEESLAAALCRLDAIDGGSNG